ncbi:MULTISPECIES: AraC family transcriptional regulator [unclassified Oceanispirochaeta]|nr:MULTISPECIES: helix-turn-helix transcriptional regulator [unclassified Oceanispirochaeta]MBF9016820.1 helix-turn-helix transcriptional regulator [Oceanispirochaeta sp. M2]NPD72090.1 helix-turn-helix transcriptional regulator [Oceanispirochaeta sp. M1]RDG32533.1 AraC family transcriptional regulator [Oceanispirochaeta sp. M1]
MLKINSADLHICHKDWFWDTSMTSWSDTDLWYVSRGSGEIKTPKGSFPLYRGECFFLKGNERYIASQNPEATLHVYAVHFESDPECDFSRIQARDADFLDAICKRIIEHWQNDENDDAVQWLKAAFCELKSSDRISDTTVPNTKLRISEAVKQASERNFINVSVEDMAGWFGSSREHFSRVFINEKAMTPQDFILSRRIAMACSLLLSTNYTVSMISDRMGYSDVSFFSRQFKKKMKISPSRYRTGNI